MSQVVFTQPRLSLTAQQEAIILQVLERNHAYYMAQGMSRAHMWPEELLSEVRNELRHRASSEEPVNQRDGLHGYPGGPAAAPTVGRAASRSGLTLVALFFFIVGGLTAEALATYKTRHHQDSNDDRQYQSEIRKPP